jgi:glycine/D-amino acid oxidase-like deaminating enzyme
VDRVVIVGGGVLCIMHAVQARKRGLDVVHLEREPGPRGASVRNFGLVWVGGRAAGPELSLAQRARTLWEELGALVPGVGFRPHGSLTLASDEAELSLLKEAAELPDAAERGFELIDPMAAAEISPALRGEFAGALLCRRDATALPPTRRRWAGVYSQVTGQELYHRSQVAPGVTLVTGPGGRGITCSPAIAEETFAA